MEEVDLGFRIFTGVVLHKEVAELELRRRQVFEVEDLGAHSFKLRVARLEHSSLEGYGAEDF